jgi:putative transposase
MTKERNGNGNADRNADLQIGKDHQANREIGGPGVWRSRGYLPHFDGSEATQHVTFHLADSLPYETLDRMEEELRLLPPDRRNIERRKRVEDWIDGGHGSCALREPVVAALVQGAFLHFDGSRYRVLAWVVMPNHVHVLFQPIHGWTVAKIVASWKKFTARRICDFRRAKEAENGTAGNADLQIGKDHQANREIGGPGDPGKTRTAAPVWHREYWDRFIRNERHFQQAVEYIHQNPVKAGLVERPEQWPWSSACTMEEKAR